MVLLEWEWINTQEMETEWEKRKLMFESELQWVRGVTKMIKNRGVKVS